MLHKTENKLKNYLTTNMPQQVLRKRIMRRVYTVWVLKKLTSPIAMKLLILAGIMKQSFSLVSVSNVIKNSPSFLDPVASSTFVTRAFLHTELSVQFLTLATLALLLWFIRDAIFKPNQFGYQNLRKA